MLQGGMLDRTDNCKAINFTFRELVYSQQELFGSGGCEKRNGVVELFHINPCIDSMSDVLISRVLRSELVETEIQMMILLWMTFSHLRSILQTSQRQMCVSIDWL